MIRHQPQTTNPENPPLIQCAHLILPNLRPSDLAAASLACKTLYQVAAAITLQRASDATAGLERASPIPFVNTVDSQRYYYFTYTPTQVLPNHSVSTQEQSPFLFAVENAAGCVCEGHRCSDEVLCPCEECGPSCGCGSDCGNRETQGGVGLKLRIVKDERKGWGLVAGEFIRKGQFVCEYAGEVLSTKEARRRQQLYDEMSLSGLFSPALLVVKEHLPSGNACMRINIDSTRIGNVARFINHSCDGGNISSTLVRSSGALLPRVCFFASRDILGNEELTFSYGDIRLNQKGMPCFCGTPSCLGVLPSEHT